jgi:hypothetical protein
MLARQLVSAGKVWLSAQLRIAGAVVSRTITVAVQFVELPAASETASVTTVEPRGTRVPAGGACVTLTAVQLSVAETSPVRSGRAAWHWSSALMVRSAAHEAMVGGV